MSLSLLRSIILVRYQGFAYYFQNSTKVKENFLHRISIALYGFTIYGCATTETRLPCFLWANDVAFLNRVEPTLECGDK